MSALGFFGGDDVSSSSDEDVETVTKVVKRKPEESDNDDDGKEKLPSPTKLLSSIQRPDFLKSADAQARRDLIAEKRAQLEQDRINASGTHTAKGMYGAMAPPAEIDSVLSAKPVKYATSSVADAVHAAPVDVTAVKRAHEGEDGNSSKKKVESFGQKEKRKRDLGQASREKSYVEEEKRQLREATTGGKD